MLIENHGVGWKVRWPNVHMDRSISFLLFAFLFCLFGCATGEKLDEYPRSEIDRPFSLPKKIKSYTVLANATTTFGSDCDSSSSSCDASQPLFFFWPLNWSYGLTDKFTLDFSPLPLGGKYQIYHDDTHTVGLSFAYFFIAGFINLNYRLKLSDQFALEPALNFTRFDFLVLSYDRSSADLGLLWQTNPVWSLKLVGGRGQIKAKSEFLEELFDSFSENKNSDLTYVDHFWQLNFESLYSFDRQWDWRQTVGFTRYDNLSDNTVVEFGLALNHYWE